MAPNLRSNFPAMKNDRNCCCQASLMATAPYPRRNFANNERDFGSLVDGEEDSALRVYEGAN